MIALVVEVRPQCRSHVGGTEDRRLRVDPESLLEQGLDRDDLDFPPLLQGDEIALGEPLEDEILLPTLHLQPLGLHARDDVEVHGLEVRLRAVVLRVGLQLVQRAPLDEAELIWPGPGGVRTEPLRRVIVPHGVLLDGGRARHERAVGRCEVVQEDLRWLAQVDHERRRIRRSHRLDVGEHVGGAALEVDAPLEARFGCGRVERCAVAELDAVKQFEREGPRAVGHVPGFRERPDDLRRRVLVPEKALVDGCGDREALRLVIRIRVERRGIGGQPGPEEIGPLFRRR